MASTIKVDNVQNQPGTNIVSKCGTDVTLGASGDTVALAAGASQTGFGRTGTVNWDTASIKTSGFTAVSSNGYFCNTSGGAFNATLPSSPSAGDIVAFSDYAGTFGTYNLTILRNSSNFEGGTANGLLSTKRQQATFVYVDVTQGWVPINENDSTFQQPLYVVATSPCVATCGDYKIHTFTGPGAFCVSAAGNSLGSNTVDYFVVAGGGGGGGTSSGHDSGGGGGAGGFRLSNSTCMPAPQTSPLAAPNSPTPGAVPVTATPYTITVGGGGAGGIASPSTIGTNGIDSSFSTITSTGGGGGGGFGTTPQLPGSTGGSGGGASGGGPATAVTGAAGNTPVQSPAQGQPGGPGSGSPNFYGGGGGGAACAGAQGESPNTGGPGGTGSYVVSAGFAVCTGTPGPVPGARYFAGGAGGGGAPSRPVTGGGSPGTGGGGSGHPITAGGCNTGGGGGGGDDTAGSNGGSGIVIIRYKFQ